MEFLDSNNRLLFPFSSLLLLLVTTMFTAQIVVLASEQEFEQYRQLRCTTPDGLTKAGPTEAKCRLVLKDTEAESPGRTAPSDDLGCFSEDKKAGGSEGNSTEAKKISGSKQSAQHGSKRVLCNLVCPNASIWFHSPIEQGHKACFKGFGYGLEERGTEWYVWRADKCLNSTGTFTVGCKWRANDMNKEQFPNDRAVFTQLANGSAGKEKKKH